MRELLSADDALRWAFRTERTVILGSTSAYQDRSAPSSTERREATPFDQHAQAALVTRLVEDLAPLERAYLRAKYARMCDASEAAEIIKHARKALAPRRATRKALALICSAYLGQHVPWRTLREELGCGQARVKEAKELVFKAFDVVHDRSIELLERRMRSSGVIVLRLEK